MYDWKLILISSLSLALFTLGITVIIRRFREIEVRFWGLFMIFSSLWVLSIAGFFYNLIFPDRTIWLKFTHSFGLFTALSLFLFLRYYFKEKILIKNLEFLLTIIGIFLLFIIFFTNLIVGEARDFSYEINILYSLYSAFLLVTFLFCYYILVIQLFKTFDTIQKINNILIFIGIVFSSVPALIFDLVLPYFGIFNYTWLGPMFIVFGVFAISLAIFKYKLFNITMITSEIIIFILWYFNLFRILNSTTPSEIRLNVFSLFFTIILGILLIRSVLKEVEQREKLEILNKELERLNKIRTEFLSIASHQIRSPMVNIRGFLELLLQGYYGDISSKAKEILLKIYRNINEEINLVNNLLDYRKIEEGRMEYNFENINLVHLIRGVYDFYKIRAEEKNLEFIFESDKEEIVIKGDEEKLKQVFVNIIDNAIKYTDKGFIKINIKEKDNEVLVSVQDTGRGISKEDLEKIFEQFERGGVDRKIAGSGLGLYISKEIIKAHKGKIWVESEGEGKGSTFYVELPFNV